jgi:hypothetical protein
MSMNAPSTDELVRSYQTAKKVVVDGGFPHEIAWQATVGTGGLTPAAVLREAAWVVLSSGMQESVVRALFGRLAQAVHDPDPTALAADRTAARAAALTVFGHVGKIDAILGIAVTADRLGEDGLRQALQGDPQPFLCSLPYVGTVTWRHLAKNLVCGSRSRIGTWSVSRGRGQGPRWTSARRCQRGSGSQCQRWTWSCGVGRSYIVLAGARRVTVSCTSWEA